MAVTVELVREGYATRKGDVSRRSDIESTVAVFSLPGKGGKQAAAFRVAPVYASPTWLFNG